jgi:hypothetical protein
MKSIRKNSERHFLGGCWTLLGVVLVLGLAVPSWAQTLFFDDFTGPEGASLDGRVPPGGGGTWTVEFGSAVISDNRARILDQVSPPPGQFPECDEPEPPPHCFPPPMPGRIRLILDTPVTTSHRFQITVVDYVPSAESVDIRAEETPFGFGVWRVAFDRAVGIIVPQVGDPSFVVVLPLSEMQPGTYAVTFRDVNFSAQTFAVDVSATFSSGGGVSATAAGLHFDLFPLFTVGGVAAVTVEAFQETPTDGVLIDDVRLALVPTEIAVAIDIKPGGFPNGINPRSSGTIPVAILSSSTFDAPANVDQTSLTFGRTGNEPSLAFCNLSPEDVNGDGFLDLVCHFNTQQTGFQAVDTEGILKGQTVDAISIEGRDSVLVVP